PITANAMTHTQTYFDCSTVFLQRLANPARPYNPPPYDASGNPDPYYNSNLAINPYITVDWQTIDVHVFNGEENRYTMLPPMGMPPFAPGDDSTGGVLDSTTPLRFRTRQRGYVTASTAAAASPTTLQPTSNPWPPVTDFSWPWDTTNNVSRFY